MEFSPLMANEIELAKGIFVVSIDFELAWGYVDEKLTAEKKAAIRREAEAIIRLLNLFDEYNIPATWGVVGHLLENDCVWSGGRAHADFPRPIMADEKRDWFAAHPAPSDPEEDLWFDRCGLVDAIRQARAGHEIASHSYAHLLYGSKQSHPRALEKDLAKAASIHQARGLACSTFIFPRNSVGQLDLLRKYGFVCYRGRRTRWYDPLPRPLGRLAHLASYLSPIGLTSAPAIGRNGLVDIPDSLLLMSRGGVRRHLPPACVARKARNSLARAAARQEIFHLWFHPYNLVFETERQFAILRSVFQAAARLRGAGKIDILTMKDAARKVRGNCL